MTKRLLPVAAATIAALLMFASCGDDDTEPSTNYPPAGEDRFESTAATVELEITPEGASRLGVRLQELEMIELEGPALVTRGEPRLDGVLYVVDTEIVSLELRGTSSTLGPVLVRQHPDLPSLGEVRQQEPGQDFPADSFFDIFIEIDLPDLDIIAVNQDPLRLEATLNDLPPAAGDEYRGANGEPLPIYTESGIQIGRIVDALHIPEPLPDEPDEPEATEEPETPTATEEAPEVETMGGCVHGDDESTLFIDFWGLEPDEVLNGTVSGPPGGLLEGGDLFGVADDEGHASLPVEIALFGTYTWDANSIQGSFTVEEECPE